MGKKGPRDATEFCTVQFTAELWKVGSAIKAKSRKPSQSEANKETIVAVGRYDPRPNKTYNPADNLNRPLVNQILLFNDRKSFFFFPSCFHLPKVLHFPFQTFRLSHNCLRFFVGFLTNKERKKARIKDTKAETGTPANKWQPPSIQHQFICILTWKSSGKLTWNLTKKEVNSV